MCVYDGPFTVTHLQDVRSELATAAAYVLKRTPFKIVKINTIGIELWCIWPLQF